MRELPLYIIIIIPLLIIILSLFLYAKVIRPKTVAKRNRIILNDLRKNLIAKKNYLRSLYISQLTLSLQKVTDKIITLLEKVRQIDPDQISTITKICNHRTVVLTIKSELKKLADRIVDDFTIFNNYLPIPFSKEDIIENQQSNLNNILSVLVLFESELDVIKKQEISVFETVNEIKKLKKPGLLIKISYILNEANRFEDKRSLEKYFSSWDQYLEAWKKLRIKILSPEGSTTISEALDNYLEKLFVFTCVEQMTIKLKLDKTYSNSLLTEIKSKWCAL
jgi:hypothetical protein